MYLVKMFYRGGPTKEMGAGGPEALLTYCSTAARDGALFTIPVSSKHNTQFIVKWTT